jgi:hypothetical protein
MGPIRDVDDSQKNSSHIVATLHAGFHLRQINIWSVSIARVVGKSDGRTEPGWKSDMEKQIFLSG